MADLTVTKESCIPVTAFQKSNDLCIDINYMGISIGIADMAIFNIPYNVETKLKSLPNENILLVSKVE
jgi:hypothetical protein